MQHFGEEIIMAKRKPEPAGDAQLDMFGGWTSISTEPCLKPTQAPPAHEPTDAANDQIGIADNVANAALVSEVETSVDLLKPENMAAVVPIIEAIKLSNGWGNDEWWTTAMVCAFLKLGRKAIWERTRSSTIGFPQPTHFGSCRHRWRAGEVKAWAENGVGRT
jgi:predicted DNA-binding transcriptional regulator AlpA